MEPTSINISVFTDTFAFLSRLIFQEIDTDLESIKLTKMELLLVLIVATKEGITMTELANQVGTSKVQISRSISRLEKSHMVQRITNQDNRRIVNVHMTEEGKILFQYKEERIKEKLAATFAILKPEDYQKIMNSFKDIFATLIKYPEFQKFHKEIQPENPE